MMTFQQSIILKIGIWDQACYQIINLFIQLKVDMKGKTMLMILFVATLFVYAQGQYQDLIKIDLPDNVMGVQFSNDHRFIGISQQSGINIYNGHTTQFLHKIAVGEQLKLSTFQFSNDGYYLMLGLNDGSAHLYMYSEEAKNYEDTGRSYTPELQSKITSICFSRNNDFAVLGQNSNNFIIWNLQQDQFLEDQFGGQFVFSVACSSVNNLFAVGGGSGATSKLTLFTASFQTNISIEVVHQFEAQLTATIFDMAFSQVNNTLNTVGRKNFVSVYDLQTYEEEKIMISGDTNVIARKIRISSDQLYMVVGQEGLITVLKDGEVDQKVQSPIYSFGLSFSADNLVYIPNNSQKSGSLASLCSFGYYYDQQECIACESSCSICQKAGGQCYYCTEGHYLKYNSCYDCIKGCLSCSDGDTCQKCDTSSHFVSKDGVCVCEEGTFLYHDMCVPCAEGCLSCKDLENCDQCDSSKGFQLHNGICQCAQRFYDDSGVCKACGKACLTCLNQNFCYTCDSSSHYALKNRECVCDSDQHFIDDGENCVCDKGFFLNGNTCQECLIGCESCEQGDTCNKCFDGFHIDGDICICDDPAQYIDEGQRKCENCNNTLEYCRKCDNPDTCQQCVEGVHRHLQGGECICDDGYYRDDENICQPCQMYGCLTCESSDECTQCNQQDHWILHNSTCQCDVRYVQISDICVKCSDGCLTCTQDECLECDTENHWEDDGSGACICSQGFYQDQDVCQKCMIGCLDCDSIDTCNTCDTQAGFIDQDGKCVCKPGEFAKDDTCVQCARSLPHCEQCSSQSQCTTCLQPFIIIKGQCGCEKGYFIDSDKCSKCGEACLQCSGLNKCTQCEDGYKLDNGVCKKENPVIKSVLVILLVLFIADIIFRLLK